MKTKQTLVILVLLAVFFQLTACLGPSSRHETDYRSGTYEGSSRGLRGAINVRLDISNGEIVNIEIIEHREAAFPGTAAMEELQELVLETGSTDLDAISGATFSSRGFLEAVEDALDKATEAQRFP